MCGIIKVKGKGSKDKGKRLKAKGERIEAAKLGSWEATEFEIGNGESKLRDRLKKEKIGVAH